MWQGRPRGKAHAEREGGLPVGHAGEPRRKLSGDDEDIRQRQQLVNLPLNLIMLNLAFGAQPLAVVGRGAWVVELVEHAPPAPPFPTPETVEVARRHETVEGIRQLVYPVDRDRKEALLAHLIRKDGLRQVLDVTLAYEQSFQSAMTLAPR